MNHKKGCIIVLSPCETLLEMPSKPKEGPQPCPDMRLLECPPARQAKAIDRLPSMQELQLPKLYCWGGLAPLPRSSFLPCCETCSSVK